jgi:hypothetical protein
MCTDHVTNRRSHNFFPLDEPNCKPHNDTHHIDTHHYAFTAPHSTSIDEHTEQSTNRTTHSKWPDRITFGFTLVVFPNTIALVKHPNPNPKHLTDTGTHHQPHLRQPFHLPHTITNVGCTKYLTLSFSNTILSNNNPYNFSNFVDSVGIADGVPRNVWPDTITHTLSNQRSTFDLANQKSHFSTTHTHANTVTDIISKYKFSLDHPFNPPNLCSYQVEPNDYTHLSSDIQPSHNNPHKTTFDFDSNHKSINPTNSPAHLQLTHTVPYNVCSNRISIVHS